MNVWLWHACVVRLRELSCKRCASTSPPAVGSVTIGVPTGIAEGVAGVFGDGFSNIYEFCCALMSQRFSRCVATPKPGIKGCRVQLFSWTCLVGDEIVYVAPFPKYPRFGCMRFVPKGNSAVHMRTFGAGTGLLYTRVVLHSGVNESCGRIHHLGEFLYQHGVSFSS